MVNHKVVSVDNLQSSLDLYIERYKAGNKTLSRIKYEMMREFEAMDRRRGVPYLSVTPEVSSEFLLEYKEHVEFEDGEEAFDETFMDASLFADEDEEIEEGYEVEDINIEGDVEDEEYESNVVHESEVVEDYSEPVVDVVEEEKEFDVEQDSDGFDLWADIEGYVSNEYDEEEEYEDDLVPLEDDEEFSESIEEDYISEDTAESGENPLKEEPVHVDYEPETVVERPKKKRVVKKVIRRVKKKPEPVIDPSPTEGYRERSKSDDFDRRIAKAKEAKPKVSRSAPESPVEKPRTLRELVKANPNCKASFAAQYFSKREIEKNIRMGRVFVKNGRLNI